MAIGWVSNLADAQAYFDDERLETSAWDYLLTLDSTGDLSSKALLNAYNRLYYLPEYDLPTHAEASASDLIILRKAQCEMAYYLCVHLADEDRRMGLQAQNVIEAGIVKEKYSEDRLNSLPIPAYVIELLSLWSNLKPLHIADLDRDENLSAKRKMIIEES
jgi:hypothetical protein